MPCPGTFHEMAPFESMKIFEVNGATGNAVPSQTETLSLYSKILTQRWCGLQVVAGQTSAKHAQIFTTPYKGHMTTPCQVPRISGIV